MKSTEPRTSLTHPLQIAEIRPAASMGLIGLTLCPGKQQSWGLTGSWARDLDLDLDAVAAWNAAAVVSLVESHELERLQVSGLGEAVRDRHMEWVHLPIRDRDVPDGAFEAAWQDTGERLRDRLRAGFSVLVHCMGGLGRAGTIASRLLVEIGWDPEQAIRAVRKVRPGALETDGQEHFVYGSVAVPEHQPDTSSSGIRERAIGSLLGLAVGDALGTTLEFSSRDSRPRLTALEGGGPFNLEPGQWTDHTSMALALADSLLACDGLNEHDLMTRFVRWMNEGAYSSNGRCFDIGNTVRVALMRFKASGDPIAGPTDPKERGEWESHATCAGRNPLLERGGSTARGCGAAGQDDPWGSRSRGCLHRLCRHALRRDRGRTTDRSAARAKRRPAPCRRGRRHHGRILARQGTQRH